jgi:Asp-tRNA(Asn)/Glu-tRNA(Gln) amidotransferase A subunit family amidase
MTDIFSLKVEELAAKIKDAQISSVEICERYIERINKFEKDIKAWAHFDKKVLLEKASEADDHRKSGKPLGPLHGIPVAVKDIIGTVDMPTECGTVIRKGKSYSQNAEIVDLLLNAGAIVMGKTATSELAYLGPPKTTNPHDYSRTPGGSSSGSAASVASFMAPLSIGSQTGGSIIRPASYCGVVGYKPSYGLISRNGVLKTSNTLDHIGMFGRTVEDVALLAKILIKKDKHDPVTIHYSAENI